MHKIVLSIVLISIFAGSFTATVHSEELNGTSDPNVVAEFEIDVKRLGYILVPVTFGGKECIFLLDTGCTVTILDVSFKSKLGRPRKRTRAYTFGNAITLDLFDAPDAFLGTLNLKVKDSMFFGCDDLEYFSQWIGRQIDGIIGMSFLRNHVVRIDFDKGWIKFLRPDKGARHNWGVELPITYGRYEQPLIKVNILERVDTYLALDTGMGSSGSLNSAMIKYILLLQEVKAIESEFLTPSGPIVARELRINSFSLGPFKYKNLIFSEGSVSCLGLQFFSRHMVTFDFPNSRIYLKKGKEFNRGEESGMAGLAFLRVAGRTVVWKVYEGSPSQKAGIKAGDIILDIMGKTADLYEMWEIGQLLRSGDKRKVEMTIKRDDEIRKVCLVLEKRI